MWEPPRCVVQRVWNPRTSAPNGQNFRNGSDQNFRKRDDRNFRNPQRETARQNVRMLLTLAWGSLGVAILFGATLAVRRHDRAARLAKLRAEWGRARDVDRDMKAIAAYYPGRAISSDGQSMAPHFAPCGIRPPHFWPSWVKRDQLLLRINDVASGASGSVARWIHGHRRRISLRTPMSINEDIEHRRKGPFNSTVAQQY